MYTRVTSHESRPGKPSCLHLRSSPRGFPRPAVEQITGNTGLGEPLGYYPKHQHKMLHNDAAQQRPGEKPASAPEASQKSIRTQGQAKFKISTLASKGSRPEHTNAASLTGGNMETPHMIHIHGRHSPLTRLDLMTHTMEPTQPPVQGSTKKLWQQPTPLPRLARHHPFGEGHVPARSVLRLEQGTEQGQLPRHATEDLQQNLEQS